MNALRIVAVLSVTLLAAEVKAVLYPAYDSPSSACYAMAEPSYGQLASPYCGASCAQLLTPPPPEMNPCAQPPSPCFQIPYNTIPCQDLTCSAPSPSPYPVPCAPPPSPCPVSCPPLQTPCPSPFTPQSPCSSPSGATISFNPSLLNVYKFISSPKPSSCPPAPCKSLLRQPKPCKKLIPLILKPYPCKALNPCVATPPSPCRPKYEVNLSPFTGDLSAFSQFNNVPSSMCECYK